MALDVFVGTLTRYYTQDWENVVQAMARKSGTTYVKLGGSGDAPPADEVRPEVLRWRDELRRQWASRVPDAPDWREDDGIAYFTDRPGWEGLEAVQLQALCVDAGQAAPRKRPRDASEHPLWKASHFTGSRFKQLFEADLWLPWDFDFVETMPSPPGNEITVGSAFTLLRQLQALNQATYRADAATLAAWRVKQPGRSPLARWLGDPFPPYFKYGLALLIDLCQKAVDERLPMRTDY